MHQYAETVRWLKAQKYIIYFLIKPIEDLLSIPNMVWCLWEETVQVEGKYTNKKSIQMTTASQSPLEKSWIQKKNALGLT